MMRPTLLMLHGWGFDASLWSDLARSLAAYRVLRWDRGYFGTAAKPQIGRSFVAIGHSLGAMLLAGQLPADVPLVAINGFDHFTGPGAIAARVMDRMQARFCQDPRTVLNDFRQRCGAAPHVGPIEVETLAADLALLATGRVTCSRDRLLVLQGAADPILPPSLRADAFHGAERIERRDGGHLLPMTHPGWCAEQIESFLCV